jgi:hypothetical protein
MKSLSVKIPLRIAQLMDDNAQLNPNWVTGFLVLNYNKTIEERPVEMTFNYTFKVNDELHKTIKLKAIDHDLPINEFVARLLSTYYEV